MRSTSVVCVIACALTAAAQPADLLLPFESVEGVEESWGRAGTTRSLSVMTGEGNVTEGGGALHLTATATAAEGNHYFGVIVPLPEPRDLTPSRIVFDARTTQPATTQAFYVRLYNQGESQPAWSYNSWSSQLKTEWRTFTLQKEYSEGGLA